MGTAMASILGALIGAAASIVVCIINNNKQNALIAYRLEQLERKVEKHNNLVERMTIVEQQIKVANHRIDDLEGSERAS